MELVYSLEEEDDQRERDQGNTAPTEMTAAAREEYKAKWNTVQGAFHVCGEMGKGKAVTKVLEVIEQCQTVASYR